MYGYYGMSFLFSLYFLPLSGKNNDSIYDLSSLSLFVKYASYQSAKNGYNVVSLY